VGHVHGARATDESILWLHGLGDLGQALRALDLELLKKTEKTTRAAEVPVVRLELGQEERSKGLGRSTEFILVHGVG